MDCSGKPVWTNATRETFKYLQIDAPDELVKKRVRENWDRVAKPLDGLGSFEDLTAQIGAITGTDHIDLTKKALLIFCADNGIVEEGVSQSGQEITVAVAKKMGEKLSSAGKMAEAVGVDTIPIDIGMNCRESIPGVLDRKIRPGTRNFRTEPAMTEEETLRAVFTGIELVFDCKKKGYGILATGEMGIGNTTTSSAVCAALLGCEANQVTGRGAGLDDAGLLRKCRIIDEAVKKYDLTGKDALTVLSTVGGFDLAGLAGVCIGGALFHIPVVLDGVITMAAALTAERMVPGVRDYLLPSHKGKEPAVEVLAKELGLKPVIDGKLALGEGTGAVMMLGLLTMALRVYENRTTFSDLRMEPYKRFK